MTFAEFIDGYLAHVIAIVALLQVWLIVAWKRWVQKPHVEFHPSANIEIGFSTYGSTISLPGAIRVLNKDAFITHMSLRIVRVSDRAEHRFDWRAFKATTFDTQTLAHKNIEIATPFTVPISTPRPITVFFASENFAQIYANDAGRLRASWSAFGARKQEKVGAEFGALLQNQNYVDELFQEFSNDGGAVEFYTRLNHGFFWHAGDYKMDLAISAADVPDVGRSWAFTITTDDETRLRLNVISTMKELCNIQIRYDFVYKGYSTDA